MRIGVSVYNVRAADLVGLAVAADQAGFSSLWLGEHLVLPWGYGSEHPTHGDTPAEELRHPRIIEESTELLDPFVALAAAAAVTSRIRLATGIYLLPLRHPLLTARGVASLADLSGGRFMLGVGSGWLQEEFDALDVPFATRGSRYEESLAVLRAAFRGGPFEHAGRHWKFGPVQITPEAGRRSDRPRRQQRCRPAAGRRHGRRLVRVRQPDVRRGRRSPRPPQRPVPGTGPDASRPTCGCRRSIRASWVATRRPGSTTCCSGPRTSAPPAPIGRRPSAGRREQLGLQ